MDRYFTLHYVSDDVTIGTLFFVEFEGMLRVNSDLIQSRIKIMHGNYVLFMMNRRL